MTEKERVLGICRRADVELAGDPKFIELRSYCFDLKNPHPVIISPQVFLEPLLRLYAYVVFKLGLE